ncbi:MAG: toll/interleukin-1 receptor domain-containing protein [Phycisphaerae bacterium]|nr:toll/interleukin-1 receptor domain-containing protein [Phycisphaerae bacterium]
MTVTSGTARSNVFISYCHEDERWRKNLETHLKPYVRSGSITAWSDQQIKPGSKWLDEIRTALASAKVAVLLVTPNFLASDFIHEEELAPLLKEAEHGGVRILWVPVRPSSYEESPLRHYQAVIDPKKSLALMKAERDGAWVRICKEIQCLVGVVRAPDGPGPRLESSAMTEVVTGKDTLRQETKVARRENPPRHRIMVLYGSWDEKWKKILSKHLNIPDRLGILKWYRMSSVRENPSWTSEFELIANGCLAIVLLVSAKLIESESMCDGELGKTVEAAVNTKRLRVLPLMTNPCSGLRLPAWLPTPDKDIFKEQTQPQSGRYREQLRQHAVCADIATELGNMLKNDSICDSISNADMVQLYRWRVRESILLSSASVDVPFYWDLFALPIQCRSHPGRRGGTVNLRCERLLLQGGKHVLLLGAPASGKTTACKRLEAYPPDGVIPLRLGSQIPGNVKSLMERLSDKENTGITEFRII